MEKDYCLLNFRVLAFMAAVVFMSASCEPVAVSEEKGRPPLVPVTPVIIPQIVMPSSSYLSDNYKPATVDTGKTAFSAIFKWQEDSVCNFAGISEESGSNTVVRFLDGKNNMAVSMYFIGESQFPEYFILNHGEDKNDGFIGIFLDYSESGKTFSSYLQYGEGDDDGHLFENITLNTNVFMAGDYSLTAREWKYIAAASVWTALTSQLNAVPSEAGPAVEAIRLVGGMVRSFGFDSFPEDAIIKPGTLIGAVGRQPIVVASSIVEPVTVNGGGPSDVPSFELYYMDESGTERSVPVMREEQTPQITQQFYIRPHGKSIEYASNVKLYFKVSAAMAGQLMLRPALSRPGGLPYAPVNVRAGSDGVHYLEVNKQDGYRQSKNTRLTVKVVNGTQTANEENPAYLPQYYVNGEEFNGSNGFVINFLDYATPDEQTKLLIPQSTAIQVPLIYDFSMPDIVFPSNAEMLDIAAKLK
jgi:hypothetical protein